MASFWIYVITVVCRLRMAGVCFPGFLARAHEKTRAIRNAAVAATPPINIV